MKIVIYCFLFGATKGEEEQEKVLQKIMSFSRDQDGMLREALRLDFPTEEQGTTQGPASKKLDCRSNDTHGGYGLRSMAAPGPDSGSTASSGKRQLARGSTDEQLEDGEKKKTCGP